MQSGIFIERGNVSLKLDLTLKNFNILELDFKNCHEIPILHSWVACVFFDLQMPKVCFKAKTSYIF